MPNLREMNYKEVTGQVQALNGSLRIRRLPTTLSKSDGKVIERKVYTYNETVENEGYTWLHIGENQWIAKTDDLTENIVTFIYPTEYIAVTTYYKSSHLGIDLGWNADRGYPRTMPIIASCKGEVVKVWEFGDAGLTIRIKTDWGKYSYYTQYKHLSKAIVKAGDMVEQGQIIGKMGNSGAASKGYHLHFDLVRCGLNYNYTQKNASERKKYSVNPQSYCVATNKNVLSYDPECTKGIIFDEEVTDVNRE